MLKEKILPAAGYTVIFCQFLLLSIMLGQRRNKIAKLVKETNIKQQQNKKDRKDKTYFFLGPPSFSNFIEQVISNKNTTGFHELRLRLWFKKNS